MYLRFYRLTREPFHITPDPDFLFLSPAHKEALGAIMYGVRKRKGFVSVTGEVGTGKSTVVRAFLAGIDRDSTRPIYIFNANVTFDGLLAVIFRELGITPGNDDQSSLVEQLHASLVEQYRQGRNIVLIIDEAQNMPVATLEQLRMLSNLETTKDKLLQIILLGQPELEEKLNRHELRQLRQRLAVRATLHPFTAKESHDYIDHRLSRAGGSTKKIFSARAVRRIVRYAKGFPRMLNILCDNALIAGYGEQKKRISLRLVENVIADYEGKGGKTGLKEKSAWLAAFVSVAALLLAQPFLDQSPPAQMNPEPGPSSSSSFDGQLQLPGTSYTLGASGAEQDEVASGRPDTVQVLPLEPAGKVLVEKESGPFIAALADVSAGRDGGKDHEEGAGSAALDEEADMSADNGSLPPGLPQHVVQTDAAGQPTIVPVKFKRRCKERIVKKGEYLRQLCMEVYGYSNDQLVAIVRQSNPHIKNINKLQIGDALVFPLISPRVLAN